MGTSLVNVNELVGKKVIGQKALTLGEVKGVEADTEKWTVTYLVLNLTNEAASELGFKKRFGSQMVRMPVSLINAVGDVITIDKAISELKRTFELIEYKE